MPKAKARRRGAAAGKRPASTVALAENKAQSAENKAQPHARTRATRPTPQKSVFQGLVMPAMVALGCWGLAISFAFFTTDPNRYLYGGMAVVMALMWSYSFARKLRKLRNQK